MSDKIRVAIADDHTVVREGTRRLLEACADIDIVAESADGPSALAAIRELQPDVAILDIRLPGLTGIEVARELQHDRAQTKVLVLSAFDDEAYVLAALGAGARGYLLKNAPANDLIEAVRAIHREEAVLHPQIAHKVAALWERKASRADDALAGRLTARETEVLELLSKGLRNKQIAFDLGVRTKTVETHVRSIFTKLGASTRTEAVTVAISHGLVEVVSDDDVLAR